MFTVTIADQSVYVGMLVRNEVQLCPCEGCQHDQYRVNGPEQYSVYDIEYGIETNWSVQCVHCGLQYKGEA